MKELPELKQAKNFLGKISSAFIDRYKLVYLLIFTVLVMGVYTYQVLPKESIPDVSFDMIVITSAYPGAGPEDIDSMVTEPIENKVEGIEDVKKVSSTIGTGYTQIVMEFEEGTDMVQAETQVRNEIASITLADGAMEPNIGAFSTSEMPIFKLTLTGDHSLTDLKKYGEEIQSQMEDVKGIREVKLSGGYEREIQVIVDFVRLQEYGLDTNSITQALQGSNINLPAGDNEIDGELLNVRIDERFKTVEDIENLVIASSSNRTIFLRDVAKVRDSHKTPEQYSRVYVRENSQEEQSTPAVYISVYRETGYDMITPTVELRKIVEEAPGSIVPSDIGIIVTADQSEKVEDDLTLVINNAAGGLISVIIVLFIFIGLNEALIVSTVIPLSLLISFLIMNFTGMSFNTISLTGFIIALGLLVDNAIVVMENVDRLREEGIERVLASKAGSNQVAPAILAATLTTIGAFLPVAMLPGIMGQFLSNLPKTIIYILFASFVVSIVVTPTLCAKFLTPIKKKDKKKRISDKMKHRISAGFIFGLSLLAFSDSWQIRIITVVIASLFTGIYLAKSIAEEKSEKTGQDSSIIKYKKFMYKLLEQKGKKLGILAIVIICLVSAIATIPLGILKLELLPYEEPTAIKVSVEAPVGTLLDETSDIAYEIESKLYKYADIESFTTNIGDNGSHNASITAELVDTDQRELEGQNLAELIRADVESIPGAEYKIEMETEASRMSGGAAISLGLKGKNLDQLEHFADLYLEQLKQIEGVVQPSTSTAGGMKELMIDLDPNKAAFYGLNVSSISRDIRSHISGLEVGTYTEDRDEYDISIYYTDQQITSVQDFDKIYFKNKQGKLINFNEVATIKYQQGPGTIKKENGDIIVYAESEIMPGYNGAEINKAFKKAVANIELPEGVEQIVGGEMKELNDQMSNMAVSFAVALALVYIVLVVQFNSLVQPIVILASVPFAIIGVVVGLVVTGNNLGFYAMFGIVALVGIAVNDAIVLMDYANYLRKEGTDLREAVAEAVKTRLQPVIATSLTTIAGVLPLALYNESFSQLGYALIFGLVASTILTLLIIPMLYYGIEKLASRKTSTQPQQEVEINE